MQEQEPDERIRRLDKRIKSLDFHIGIADGFVYGSVGFLVIFGLLMLYEMVTKA